MRCACGRELRLSHLRAFCFRRDSLVLHCGNMLHLRHIGIPPILSLQSRVSPFSPRTCDNRIPPRNGGRRFHRFIKWVCRYCRKETPLCSDVEPRVCCRGATIQDGERITTGICVFYVSQGFLAVFDQCLLKKVPSDQWHGTCLSRGSIPCSYLRKVKNGSEDRTFRNLL